MRTYGVKRRLKEDQKTVSRKSEVEVRLEPGTDRIQSESVTPLPPSWCPRVEKVNNDWKCDIYDSARMIIVNIVNKIDYEQTKNDTEYQA